VHNFCISILHKDIEQSSVHRGDCKILDTLHIWCPVNQLTSNTVNLTCSYLYIYNTNNRLSRFDEEDV